MKGVGGNFKEIKKLIFFQMIFFKNGKSCGVSFQDIYEGTYYPAISIYKNATVNEFLNFCLFK